MALLIVDCLTRFSICSLVPDAKAITLISTILNDWVRPLGKPRRIIMGNGSPRTFGTEWAEFSHAYAIQLVHAPKAAPYQNGLAERVVRSLKEALKAILSDKDEVPSQKNLTQAVMARNHVPHTVTGIPPALAMTGRCDLLAGHAATAWSHNPDTLGPIIQQPNAMRNILNARTAVMVTDAQRTLNTCLQRNLPDRSHSFYPIGSSVQIARRNKWVGTYRVIAHASSNLILEQGRKISKWPKAKARLIIPDTDDQIDTTELPDEDNRETREEDTAQIERRVPRTRVSRAKHDDPMDLDDTEDDSAAFWMQWSTRDMSLVPHQFPGLNYVNQGILLCDYYWRNSGPPPIDSSYFQYSLPCHGSFVTTSH